MSEVLTLNREILALPIRRIGNPPFFEHLFCKVPVRRVFTEGYILQERDDHSFLFCGERSESWRLPIQRPQIMEQSFNRYLRIVHVSERVVDQMGQVVPPRSRVEISKIPEKLCLKVRICQLVQNGGHSQEGIGDKSQSLSFVTDPISPNEPGSKLPAAAHRTHIRLVEIIDIVDETVEEVDTPPDAGIGG